MCNTSLKTNKFLEGMVAFRKTGKVYGGHAMGGENLQQKTTYKGRKNSQPQDLQ